jgi:hypothetical protein
MIYQITLLAIGFLAGTVTIGTAWLHCAEKREVREALIRRDVYGLPMPREAKDLAAEADEGGRQHLDHERKWIEALCR